MCLKLSKWTLARLWILVLFPQIIAVTDHLSDSTMQQSHDFSSGSAPSSSALPDSTLPQSPIQPSSLPISNTFISEIYPSRTFQTAPGKGIVTSETPVLTSSFTMLNNRYMSDSISTPSFSSLFKNKNNDSSINTFDTIVASRDTNVVSVNVLDRTALSANVASASLMSSFNVLSMSSVSHSGREHQTSSDFINDYKMTNGYTLFTILTESVISKSVITNLMPTRTFSYTSENILDTDPILMFNSSSLLLSTALLSESSFLLSHPSEMTNEITTQTSITLHSSYLDSSSSAGLNVPVYSFSPPVSSVFNTGRTGKSTYELDSRMPLSDIITSQSDTFSALTSSTTAININEHLTAYSNSARSYGETISIVTEIIKQSESSFYVGERNSLRDSNASKPSIHELVSISTHVSLISPTSITNTNYYSFQNYSPLLKETTNTDSGVSTSIGTVSNSSIASTRTISEALQLETTSSSYKSVSQTRATYDGEAFVSPMTSQIDTEIKSSTLDVKLFSASNVLPDASKVSSSVYQRSSSPFSSISEGQQHTSKQNMSTPAFTEDSAFSASVPYEASPLNEHGTTVFNISSSENINTQLAITVDITNSVTQVEASDMSYVTESTREKHAETRSVLTENSIQHISISTLSVFHSRVPSWYTTSLSEVPSYSSISDRTSPNYPHTHIVQSSAPEVSTTFSSDGPTYADVYSTLVSTRVHTSETFVSSPFTSHKSSISPTTTAHFLSADTTYSLLDNGISTIRNVESSSSVEAQRLSIYSSSNDIQTPADLVTPSIKTVGHTTAIGTDFMIQSTSRVHSSISISANGFSSFTTATESSLINNLISSESTAEFASLLLATTVSLYSYTSKKVSTVYPQSRINMTVNQSNSLPDSTGMPGYSETISRNAGEQTVAPLSTNSYLKSINSLVTTYSENATVLSDSRINTQYQTTATLLTTDSFKSIDSMDKNSKPESTLSAIKSSDVLPSFGFNSLDEESLVASTSTPLLATSDLPTDIDTASVSNPSVTSELRLRTSNEPSIVAYTNSKEELIQSLLTVSYTALRSAKTNTLVDASVTIYPTKSGLSSVIIESLSSDELLKTTLHANVHLSTSVQLDINDITSSRDHHETALTMASYMIRSNIASTSTAIVVENRSSSLMAKSDLQVSSIVDYLSISTGQAVPSVMSRKTMIPYVSPYSGTATSWTDKSYVDTSNIKTSGTRNTDTVSYVLMSSYSSVSFGVTTTQDKEEIFSTTGPNYSSSSISETIRTELRSSSKLQSSQPSVSSATDHEGNTISLSTTITELPSVEGSLVSLKRTSSFLTFSEYLLVATTDIISSTSNSTTPSTLTYSQQTFSSLSNDSFVILPTSTFVMQQENASSQAMLSDLSTSSLESTTQVGTSGVFGTLWFTKTTETVIIDTGSQLSSPTKHVSIVFKTNSYSTNFNDIFTSAGSSLQSGDSLAYTSSSSIDVFRTSSSSSMLFTSDFTYLNVDLSSKLTSDTLALGTLSDSISLFEPSNSFDSTTSMNITTVDTSSVSQGEQSNTNSAFNSASSRIISVTDLVGSFLIDKSNSQSSASTLNVIQKSDIVYSTSVSLSPTHLEASPSIVTTPAYSSVSSVLQSSYIVTTKDFYSTEVTNSGVNLNTTSSNNIATDTLFDTAIVGTLTVSYTFGNSKNLTFEQSSIFNSGVHENQNTSTLKSLASIFSNTIFPSSTFQASVIKTFSIINTSGSESSLSNPVVIDTSFDFESTEIFASTSTLSTPFLSSEYVLSSYVSLFVSSSTFNTFSTTTSRNNSMLFLTNVSAMTSTRSSLSNVASFISTTTDDFAMSDLTSSTTTLKTQSPLGNFTISPMTVVSPSSSFQSFASVSSLSHHDVVDTSFDTESTFVFDSTPTLSTQIISSESLLPSYITPLLSPSTMETDLLSTTRNNTMLFTSELPSSSSIGVHTKGISSLLISKSFIHTTSGDLTTSGFTNSMSTSEVRTHPESAKSSSLSVASTSADFQFVSFSSTYSPIEETSSFRNSSVPPTEDRSYALVSSKESSVSPSEVTRTINSDDVLSFSSDLVLEMSSHSAESKFSIEITSSIIYSSKIPLELSSPASSIRTVLSSVVSQTLSVATQTLESIKDGLVSESLTMSSTLVSPVPTYDSETLTKQATVTPIHSPDSSLLLSPRVSQSFTRYSDLSSVVESSAHPSSYSNLILSSSPVVSQKPSSTGQLSFDVDSSDETSRYLETHISVPSASTITAILLSTDVQESTKSTDSQSRSLHTVTVSTERLTASTSVIISSSITLVPSMESVIYSTALLETISPTSASVFMTNDSMMNSSVLTTAFTESINSTDVLQSQNVSAENETTATLSITLLPTSIMETVSFTSSIFNPTTEPSVVTTRNITNVEETFWVRTVLKIRRGVNITSPNFIKEMERRLAEAFNEAFVIEKLIQEGKFQPLQRRRRKKRFATSGEAAVHIHDLTRQKDSSSVTVVYAVEKSGEIMTSQDAVTSLQVLEDQELAIILQQVVDVKAETYSQTSEPEVPTTDDNFPLWMIGAIAGGVAGVIIIIWIVLCIYCKCCNRKGTYEETEPELTSILPERPKRKESKSRPLPQSPMKKSIEPHTSHYAFKKASNYQMSEANRELAEVIDTRQYIETPVRREPPKHPQHSSPDCSTTATPVLPKRELVPPAVRKGRRNSKNSIGPSIAELQLRRESVLSKERKSDISQLFQSTVSEDSDSIKEQIKSERKKNKELLREKYGLDMEIPVDLEHSYDDRDKIMLDMPNTSVPNFVIATGSPAKKQLSEQRRHSEGDPVDDENLVKAKNRMHQLLDDAFSLISPRQSESFIDNNSRATKDGLRNSNRKIEDTTEVRSGKEPRLPFSGYTNPGYTNSSEYFETWSPYRASDQVALISMPHTLVSSVTKLGGKSDKRPTTSRIGRRPASNLDILNTKVAAQPSENKKLSSAHSMTRDPAEPIKLRTKDSNSGHRLASANSRSTTTDFKANNGKPKSSSLNSGLILNGSVTSLSKLPHTDLSRSKKESVEMKPLNQNGWNTIRNHRAPERNIQQKDEIDVIQSIKPSERTDNLIQSLRDELKTLTQPETEDDINKKPIRRKNRKVNKPMTDIM